MSKSLVVYFSHKGNNYMNKDIVYLEKGNTEICAEYIQELTGADLFEVKTVRTYSEDVKTCIKEAVAEYKENARPELQEYLESAEMYDEIYVCGPCWVGTYPMAVFSLLERLNLEGKKLHPLLTHEGSGLGNALDDLAKVCPSAIIMDGLAVHGAEAKDSKELIQNWIK